MKIKSVFVGIILVFIIFACQPDFFNNTPPSTPEDVDWGKTGSVQLTIPSISSNLAKTLGIYTPGNPIPGRAVMIVSKVDLELKLFGEVIQSSTEILDSGPTSQETTIEWLLPSASGYTVSAWVYNDYNDPLNPVLYGVSDPFDVIAGANTEVWILPIPSPPETLTPISVPLAPGAASTTLNSSYDTGTTETVIDDWGPDEIEGTADDITMETPIYAWREERWYEISIGANDAIRVNADPGPNSGVYFLACDSEGKSITQAFSGLIGDGELIWEYGGVATAGLLTPGSTYFIGLITVSDTVGTSVLSTVDVNYEDFSDDIYEENDTFTDAPVITKAEVINGINLDEPWDDTFPYTGGDWYTFEVTGGDDPNITVKIVFNHDEDDLGLELYSWIGQTGDPVFLAESDDSTPSGPTDPAVLEDEQIDELLSLGTHLIWVRSNGMTNGSSYQLQWLAGNGTITIELE